MFWLQGPLVALQSLHLASPFDDFADEDFCEAGDYDGDVLGDGLREDLVYQLREGVNSRTKRKVWRLTGGWQEGVTFLILPLFKFARRKTSYRCICSGVNVSNNTLN
jgi:hypothetical protein